MKSSWFTLPLLLTMGSVISAQQPIVTPETPVNQLILEQWLHSGDPRLVAWAADFAHRTHDSGILQQMPALLEHWTIPPADATDESHAAQRRAVTAVLDSLIQENAHVSISAIRAVAEFFPVQAAILISRVPLNESRLALNGWFAGVTGGWNARLLARIASMIMAKDPDPSFVASIVAASEENLMVSVTSGGIGGGTGSGVCGDSLGRANPSGWPEVYTYYLGEHYSNEHSSPLVDVDGDRIDFWRTKESRGWGSCTGSDVEELNPVTRHRLIAHWLSVPDNEMDWQPVKQASIIWINRTAYERQLGALIEAERKKLQATFETLRQRGLLTESQGETQTPRLVVTIRCDIKPCPLM